MSATNVRSIKLRLKQLIELSRDAPTSQLSTVQTGLFAEALLSIIEMIEEIWEDMNDDDL